jgi:hypothetical protein
MAVEERKQGRRGTVGPVKLRARRDFDYAFDVGASV